MKDQQCLTCSGSWSQGCNSNEVVSICRAVQEIERRVLAPGEERDDLVSPCHRLRGRSRPLSIKAGCTSRMPEYPELNFFNEWRRWGNMPEPNDLSLNFRDIMTDILVPLSRAQPLL